MENSKEDMCILYLYEKQCVLYNSNRKMIPTDRVYGHSIEVLQCNQYLKCSSAARETTCVFAISCCQEAQTTSGFCLHIYGRVLFCFEAWS